MKVARLQLGDDYIKRRALPGVFSAILAAALYGISLPVSKLLIGKVPPALMAALLYLGAGFGMLIINVISRRQVAPTEARLSKKDWPFVAVMIILDIIAPLLLMFGLAKTTSANASLLNNFEIVATSLVALIVFKEAVGRRMWIAVTLISIASVMLSFEDISSLSFSLGSVLILLACLSWGFENNCTRMLSLKNPRQIVVIKGLGSGIGSLIISIAARQYHAKFMYIGIALLLGFISYGLSINFYILSQRSLGAARTSAYYAIAPFIGTGLSIALFGQSLNPLFVFALLIMIAGTWFAISEHHSHLHIHESMLHEHRHDHRDGHHVHEHADKSEGEHSHVHWHERTSHAHEHTPDMHHPHKH